MIGRNILSKVAEQSPLKLAIVGGGAGAREFIIRFAEAGGSDLPAHITVFEPRQALGRGVAWSPEATPVIANMRVETLGPNYHEFELIQHLLDEIHHPEASSEYPTRNAMGEALDRRWDEKMGRFPPAWAPLSHVQEEVVDLTWDGRSQTAALHCRSGEIHTGYDLVVLSMGNLRERPPEGLPPMSLVVHGWDVEALTTIPPDADVLIKGAGLTAIDVTMRLIHQGHQLGNRSIVWHSRRGSLPYIRPKQIKLNPAVFSYPHLSNLLTEYATSGKKLTIQAIKMLFAREMRDQERQAAGKFALQTDYQAFRRTLDLFTDPARGREQLEEGIKGANAPSLWFSVAKLLDEYTIPLLWNAMPNNEKVVFLQKWRRDFDRFWAPIPSINGRRIKHWLEDRTIQLLRTQISYRGDPESGRILWDDRLDDPLAEMSREQLRARYRGGFHALVDAGGIAADLRKLDSELVQNLMERAILTPYMLRAADDTMIRLGARVDWYTGAVLAADGCPHGWLFSLTGSLTAGVHRFTNSYLAVAASADRTAVALFRDVEPDRPAPEPELGKI